MKYLYAQGLFHCKARSEVQYLGCEYNCPLDTRKCQVEALWLILGQIGGSGVGTHMVVKSSAESQRRFEQLGDNQADRYCTIIREPL